MAITAASHGGRSGGARMAILAGDIKENNNTKRKYYLSPWGKLGHSTNIFNGLQKGKRPLMFKY